MKRKDKLFIKDILQAIQNIEVFIGDMDIEEFYKDEKTKSAVVWEIHKIGEATKNVSKLMRDKYKEVPWRYMARMRDKIAHFYFGIDYEIVWDVVRKKLPEIKPIIGKILKDLERENVR
ncbi:MAG: HepT-like ribonuclease domain-containing protein [bacterium]